MYYEQLSPEDRFILDEVYGKEEQPVVAPKETGLPAGQKKESTSYYDQLPQEYKDAFDEVYGEEKRSFPGYIASKAARGGLSAVEGVAGAMRMTDLDPTKDEGFIAGMGKSVSDWTKRVKQEHDIFKPDVTEGTKDESRLKRFVGGAVESIPASLMPFAAGAVATVATGNPIIGAGAGLATLFSTFGMGEYQNAYDEAETALRKQGLPEDEIKTRASKHALVDAVAETGGELAGDLAALVFFGAIGKQAIKQPLKQTVKQLLSPGGAKEFAKAYVKTVPFEAGSEMATSYAQTESARGIGISDASTKEAMIDAAGTAAVMSLFFGLSIHGMQAIEARQIYNDLNSNDANTRVKAARKVSSRLDKENAPIWNDTAASLIASGKEIPISKPIADFAVQKNATDGTAPEDPISRIEADLIRGKDESGKPFTLEQAVAIKQQFKGTPFEARLNDVINKEKARVAGTIIDEVVKPPEEAPKPKVAIKTREQLAAERNQEIIDRANLREKQEEAGFPPLTFEDKRVLKDKGYTDYQIYKMTPEKAQKILTEQVTPEPTPAPKVEQPAPVIEPEAEEAEGQKATIHDHSNVQVDLPKAESDSIRSFAAKISDSEIYTDPKDPSYGREGHPHITIRYGMDTVDPNEIKPAFADLGPIKARIGKVSIFETDKYDVVKADIESKDLEAANKRVGETVELPGETYKDYKPHITIAYVKKGEGKKYIGDRSFEGKEIVFDTITLSAKDGKNHVIQLIGKPAEPSPKPEAKEPHLMTRAEYFALGNERKPSDSKINHTEIIKQAVSEGKLTPAEAIRIHKNAYPDIESWPEMKGKEPAKTDIEREIELRLDRIYKAIDAWDIQNKDPQFSHKPGTAARKKAAEKHAELRGEAIRKIVENENEKPIENQGLKIGGKLKSTDVDLRQYFPEYFQGETAKAETEGGKVDLRPDNRLFDVESVNERIKSIQRQRDALNERAVKGHSSLAWEKRQEKIRNLTKREDALIKRLKGIESGKIVAPVVEEKPGKQTAKEKRAEQIDKEKADYDLSPAKSFVEDFLGDNENDYNKAALARFLDGTDSKYDGLMGWKWIEPLETIGVPEELKKDGTPIQDVANFIKQKYQEFSKAEPREATKAEDIAENLKKATDEWTQKYAPLIGKQYKGQDGITWQFVATNDLGVPYFSKVSGGKVQKKQFTVAGFDREWAESQLTKAETPETKLSVEEFDESDYRPSVVKWAKKKWGNRIADNGAPIWQNFVRWFGDSQVVDDAGEPLVMYHSGSFNVDEDRQFVIEDDGGIHFGTKDAALARIGGKAVDDAIQEIEVYENDDGTWGFEIAGVDYGGEFESEDEAYADAEELAAQTEADDYSYDEDAITEVYLSIKNPKVVEDKGANWTKTIAKAKQEKYDGIIYANQFEDKGSFSYIAFSPTQIKSTFNRGTFSETEADIRLSVEEAPITKETLLDARKAVIQFRAWMRKAGLPKDVLGALEVEVKGTLQVIGDATKSLKMHGVVNKNTRRILGATTFFKDGRTLVEFATNHENMAGTAYHEAFHVMLKKLMSESHRESFLEQFYKGNEEIAAKDFAKFVAGEEMKTLPKMVRKVFYRLKMMLQRIANGFRQSGYKNPEEFFRALYFGQVRAEGGKAGVDETLLATVYHGTPHVWEPEPGFPHGRARLDKTGTGENAAVYGHGIYFGETEATGEYYRHVLAGEYYKIGENEYQIGADSIIKDVASAHSKGGVRAAIRIIDERISRLLGDEDTTYSISQAEAKGAKKIADIRRKHLGIIKTLRKDILSGNVELVKKGAVYQLDIPNDVIPKLLDWDKPLSEQSEYVKQRMMKEFGDSVVDDGGTKLHDRFGVWEEKDLSGERLYYDIQKRLGSKIAASKYLASIGIPGNKYLDQMSRGEGEGTYNYVIWDQGVLDRIALLERNGEKLDAIRKAEAETMFLFGGKKGATAEGIARLDTAKQMQAEAANRYEAREKRYAEDRGEDGVFHNAWRVYDKKIDGWDTKTYASKERAERAAERENKKSADKARTEIWSDTGWYEIVPGSGQWSFEIDDSKITVTDSGAIKGLAKARVRGVKLPDILNHPALFKQYPELRDLTISLDNTIEGANFHRGMPEKGIPPSININGELYADEFRSTIVHEIQHAIQEHEGFARGGSLNLAAKLKEEFRSQLSAAKQTPEVLRWIKEQNDILDTKTLKGNDLYNALKDHGQKAPETLKKLWDDPKGQGSPDEIYRRLTGEAEARLASKRLDMTAEQRKAEPPWVTLEKMLKDEGLLKEGQKPEDVLISRGGEAETMLSVSREENEIKKGPDWIGFHASKVKQPSGKILASYGKMYFDEILDSIRYEDRMDADELGLLEHEDNEYTDEFEKWAKDVEDFLYDKGYRWIFTSTTQPFGDERTGIGTSYGDKIFDVFLKQNDRLAEINDINEEGFSFATLYHIDAPAKFVPATTEAETMLSVEEAENIYSILKKEIEKNGKNILYASPEWGKLYPSLAGGWQRSLKRFRAGVQKLAKQGMGGAQEAARHWRDIRVDAQGAGSKAFESGYAEFKKRGIELIPVKNSPVGAMVDFDFNIAIVSTDSGKWGSMAELLLHELFHLDIAANKKEAIDIIESISTGSKHFQNYANRLATESPDYIDNMITEGMEHYGYKGNFALLPENQQDNVLGYVNSIIAEEMAADYMAGKLPDSVFAKPDEVKTLIQKLYNMGRRYSSLEETEKNLEKNTLSVLEKLSALKAMPILTRKGGVDLSYFWDLLMSIPNFFKHKIHAIESMYNATQDKQDDIHELIYYMENHDDVNVIKALDSLPNQSFRKVGGYLVETDKMQDGFRVRNDPDLGWVVKDRNNRAVLHNAKTEEEAVEKMLQFEIEDLRKKGFTPEEANAVKAFRLTTNKGFEILFSAMRELVKKAKESGFDVPMITAFEDGKPVKISIEKAIAEMGDMRGYYYPRIRQRGKYTLTAKKEGAESRFETFNIGRLMNIRKAELEKQGYTVTTAQSRQLGEDVFEMAGQLIKTQQVINAALERVDKAMKDGSKEDINEIFKETQNIFATAVAEQVANVIRERGSRAHMTRRAQEYYAGFETNPSITIAKYIRGLSGGEAKRKMVIKLVRAFTGTETTWKEFQAENPDATYEDYRDHVKEMMIDQRDQPQAFKWGKAYIGEVTRNREFADDVIGMIKGVAVAKYLAFRVFSAPLVNMTALATSVPASMHGVGIPLIRAAKLLTVAMKRYATYKFGDASSLSADDKWVYDQIRHKGWDNPQFNAESISVLRSKLGRGWDKSLDIGMFTFAESERLNRIATIAATYNGIKTLTENKGKTNDELLDIAKQVSDDSHGVYNKGNYPYLAMGSNPAAQVARMFYVFRTFTHTYLMNMKKLGFEQKDYKALTYMLVSPAVIAGAGASVLTPLIAAILQAAGLDDPEEDAYMAIGKQFGPEAEQLARFGIMGAGGKGISIKGSLALGITDIPTTIKDVLGAPGSVLSDIFVEGIPAIAKGDVSKGFEKLSPTGIGNVIRAYRESKEGVSTKTNAPLFYGKEQLRPSTVETFYKTLSLNPARIARIREKQWKEYKVEEQYRQERTDIYAKLKKFYLSKNKNKGIYAEILAEIYDYNERARERGISPITKKSISMNLKRSFKASKREREREEE